MTLLNGDQTKLRKYEGWADRLGEREVNTEDALKLLLTDNTLSGIFGEAIDIVRKKLGKCNSCLYVCPVANVLKSGMFRRELKALLPYKLI